MPIVIPECEQKSASNFDLYGGPCISNAAGCIAHFFASFSSRLDTQKDLRSCGRVKWFETMYENKRYIHEVIESKPPPPPCLVSEFYCRLCSKLTTVCLSTGVPMDHRLQVRTNGRCSTGSCSSCHTVCFNSFGNHKQNHKLTNGHWVAITAAASPCSGHENQTMEESKYGPKQAQDNHTAPV